MSNYSVLKLWNVIVIKRREGESKPLVDPVLQSGALWVSNSGQLEEESKRS